MYTVFFKNLFYHCKTDKFNAVGPFGNRSDIWFKVKWVFQHLSWRNPTNTRVIAKILHAAAVGFKYSTTSLGSVWTLPSSTNVTLFCLDKDELGSNGFIFFQNSSGCFALDVTLLQNSLMPFLFSEVTLLRCAYTQPRDCQFGTTHNAWLGCGGLSE